MLFSFDPLSDLEHIEDRYFRYAVLGLESKDAVCKYGIDVDLIRNCGGVMEVEHRVTIDELALMVGVSSYTLRTWICSYKFAKYMREDNFFGAKNKLSVAMSREFYKDFIPYLEIKDSKNKGYVKNFCSNLEKLNLSLE